MDKYPVVLGESPHDSTAMADATATEIFTAASAVSIAGVFGVLAFAYVGLMKILPKAASKTDRITFVWVVSDLNSDRVDVSWRVEQLRISCFRRSTH